MTCEQLCKVQLFWTWCSWGCHWDQKCWSPHTPWQRSLMSTQPKWSVGQGCRWWALAPCHQLHKAVASFNDRASRWAGQLGSHCISLQPGGSKRRSGLPSPMCSLAMYLCATVYCPLMSLHSPSALLVHMKQHNLLLLYYCRYRHVSCIPASIY